MNFSYIVFLIIFSIIIFLPTANAQAPDEYSKQKSIEITINSRGEVHVTHVIVDLELPHQIKLIDGVISNLTVKDHEGNDREFGSIDDNTLMILPSNEETFVEYDLSDKLLLKDNVWTWDFIYLKSTSFIFPEQVDLIFADGKPAYIGEKKGILCHGCEMILEYSLDEPKSFEKIKIHGNEFLIETRTWAEIDQFSFDPVLEEISLKVIGENKFVTIIIPVDFLSEPYQAFLNQEKILFHDYINNGTHVWLNMRPQNSGEVLIQGTVVPDIEIKPEDDFSAEFVVIGIIISGIILIGVFFIKRKK